MKQRIRRFPVADEIGIYCWFCAEALDTRDPQPTGYPVGEGRYRVRCQQCNHASHFDRRREVVGGGPPPVMSPLQLLR